MALRGFLLRAILVAVMAPAPIVTTALAAGLDSQEKATLKEATRLYKRGQYEEAAKLMTDLAVEHPDMASLQRNLGACYYYMQRPEPALSNLRAYLAHKKTTLSAEDRSEVERWIDEMEKLRVRNAEATAPPAPMPEPAMPSAAPKVPPVAPVTAGETPAQPEQTSRPALVVEATPTGPTEASRGEGLRIAGITCGALGLASIGTAVYFYTRATSLSDKINNADATTAKASDFQAGKDAESMQWVFYGIGAGALVTGTVLYLLGSNQSTAPSLGLAPVLGPGKAGLSAQGVF